MSHACSPHLVNDQYWLCRNGKVWLCWTDLMGLHVSKDWQILIFRSPSNVRVPAYENRLSMVSAPRFSRIRSDSHFSCRIAVSSKQNFFAWAEYLSLINWETLESLSCRRHPQNWSLNLILAYSQDVSGRVVLITGGGGGVGRILALNFAQLKSKVVVWDINREGKII